MSNERGKIRNPNSIARLRDFSGLRWGVITPTDIDAFMDFGGKVFVFIEAKHHKGTMPKGQRLAYERLSSACSSGSVHSIVFVIEHGDEKLIDYGKLSVVEFWNNKEWVKMDGRPLREAIRQYRIHCENIDRDAVK